MLSCKVWLCGFLASGRRWRYSCAWMVVRSFHGSRQEHRSGCDTTPAGACCFLWQGPSNVVLRALDREVLNAVGLFVCLCRLRLCAYAIVWWMVGYLAICL